MVQCAKNSNFCSIDFLILFANVENEFEVKTNGKFARRFDRTLAIIKLKCDDKILH